MFGMGDEMFGKWETKCSEFRRTKVRRKSLAANQEAQIKKKICAGHSWGPIKPIEILFFSPRVPFIKFWEMSLLEPASVLGSEHFVMFEQLTLNKTLQCWNHEEKLLQAGVFDSKSNVPRHWNIVNNGHIQMGIFKSTWSKPNVYHWWKLWIWLKIQSPNKTEELFGRLIGELFGGLRGLKDC